MNQKNHTVASSYEFCRVKKTIRNRTVLAAMTNKQSYNNGIMSKEEIDWLTERAKGGFGIVTTAATNVSIESKAWNGEFGVYDDIHIPSLKKLTQSIHKTESLIFAQLFHGGMRCPEKITGSTPISASILECKESETGFSKEASIQDINKIIDDFTSAAIRCVDSGFDGIELHGAHGYLISQFLGSKTNLRKDEWGGTLQDRAKLLVKICDNIKTNVPESFIIGVRISPEIDNLGIHLHDTIKLVGILNNIGLDFIHISCWDAFASSKQYPNDNRTLTQIITDSYSNLPTIISTGNVWSSQDANNVLNQGADLVGVGRVGIAHPNWGKNIANINYNPTPPPYTSDYLKHVKLSDKFIEYMRHWNGFVVDRE